MTAHPADVQAGPGDARSTVTPTMTTLSRVVTLEGVLIGDPTSYLSTTLRQAPEHGHPSPMSSPLGRRTRRGTP